MDSMIRMGQRLLLACLLGGAGAAFGAGIEEIRKQADAGDARAMAILGMSYRRGEMGLETNITLALKYLAPAAQKGEGVALYEIALLCQEGLGVKQNAGTAARLFAAALPVLQKEAEQGDMRAQCDLGLCLESGKGIPKDEAQAVIWYRRSAEQGYPRAQCNLGICYESGIGVQADPAQAVEWYRKAADQGYARAQFNLGLCYESGTGVPKDAAQALAWCRKAAQQGDGDARAYVDRRDAQGHELEAAGFPKGGDFDYERAKQEAEKLKGQTLVFKGLYIGMPFETACRIVQQLTGTDLSPGRVSDPDSKDRFEAVLAPRDVVQALKADMPGPLLKQLGLKMKSDIRVAADGDKKVTSIFLRGRFVDKMFNAADMNAEDFARQFGESYGVSNLKTYERNYLEKKYEKDLGWHDVSRTEQGYEYSDSRGWKIRISKEKNLLLMAVPKKEERKFD